MRHIAQLAPARTQKEVAEMLGIDSSRVGQIERRALAKLRIALSGIDFGWDTSELRAGRAAMREFEEAVSG